MDKTMDMRKLIDLAKDDTKNLMNECAANGESLEFASPFKTFGSWGKLNEDQVSHDDIVARFVPTRFKNLWVGQQFKLEGDDRVLAKSSATAYSAYEGGRFVGEPMQIDPFTRVMTRTNENLGEGWDEGPIAKDEPVNAKVFKDPDGHEWFWTKAKGGHIFASGGPCADEHEARVQAGLLDEDEAGMSMVGESEHEVVHLLRPRGGSECGAECHDHDHCSPEINEVTCPACIAGHDAYCEKFNEIDEGSDLAEFIANAKREFAQYGFPVCPLTDEELAKCHELSVPAYEVGCDVNSGYSFEDALSANA